jgi:hypothetical protein
MMTDLILAPAGVVVERAPAWLDEFLSGLPSVQAEDHVTGEHAVDIVADLLLSRGLVEVEVDFGASDGSRDFALSAERMCIVSLRPASVFDADAGGDQPHLHIGWTDPDGEPRFRFVPVVRLQAAA